jgi:hypothetical protein
MLKKKFKEYLMNFRNFDGISKISRVFNIIKNMEEYHKLD